MSSARRSVAKAKCCKSELSCKATAELEAEVKEELDAPDKSVASLFTAGTCNEDEPKETDDTEDA
jgi:hypothetical protein